MGREPILTTPLSNRDGKHKPPINIALRHELHQILRPDRLEHQGQVKSRLVQEWHVDSSEAFSRNDVYKEGFACVDGFAKDSSTAGRPKVAVF